MTAKPFYLRQGLNAADLLTSNATDVIIGSLAINSSSLSLGNVFANSSTLLVDNLSVGNSSVNLIINSTSCVVGAASLNAISLTFDATGTIFVGNSSVNATINSSSFAINGAPLLSSVGIQSIWVPATAMVSRTTGGPSSGTVETSTNKNMFNTLDFDPTTQQFAQFTITMPKSWDKGTVTFSPIWSHSSTTTNYGVVWGLAAVAISDNEAGDAAFGTSQLSSDTGGTSNQIYHGPTSAAITVAGTLAINDFLIFQISRNPADANDTMAVPARLHGVMLFYTTSAGSDT